MVVAIISIVLAMIFGAVALSGQVSARTEFVCMGLTPLFVLGAGVGSDPDKNHGESHDMPHP